MKKLTTALLVSLAITQAQASDTLTQGTLTEFNHDLLETYEPETSTQSVSAIGGWIAGEIVSAAKSAVKGGIKSALKNAIFGSSGPTYVTLSQESLDAIEDIVNTSLDNVVRDDMIGLLDSLQDDIYAYHDGLQIENRDLGLAAGMLQKSNDLENHPAFSSGKSYYALLTKQYALAASLKYSIYADRVFYGQATKPGLSSLGGDLADELEARGAATNVYVNQNVYMQTRRTYPCNQVIHSPGKPETDTGIASTDMNINASVCYDYYVYDKLGGSNYNYRFVHYGNDLAYTLANRKLNDLRAQYKTKLKGSNYQETLNTLRSSDL